MNLSIKNQRDVIAYTAGITVFSILVSEASIVALYLVGGVAAFTIKNAIIFAIILPLIIAVPITYAICTMSLRLANTKAELQKLADTDPLTRLRNRRSFFAAAEASLQSALSDGSPCALMVIDADHFKDLNDSYGHAVGDRALVAIADVLRENFRQSDYLCRVGGEEFAVLLHDIDSKDAQPLAQRLVNAVQNSPIVESNAIIEYSVSCGIADTGASYELATLFKAADDAMYVAKRQGRNRVALMRAA